MELDSLENPLADQLTALKIDDVKTWAVQLQDIQIGESAASLIASSYDLIVIEPSRTAKGENASFDTKALVSRLKASPAHDRIHRKLVIAYVNIGQAEDYRWYWTWPEQWDCKLPTPSEWPSFIISCDPDGWTGNYPVAYWDTEWKKIILYGYDLASYPQQDFRSSIDEALDDGFDGVYLDWVAGLEDETVIARAGEIAINPAEEMLRFLQEIRTYAQRRNPDFLLIQQNGASLIEENQAAIEAIDAIAQECTWYCGDAADSWDDPNGYDSPTARDDTQEIISLLERYRSAGLPVFSLEYALTKAQDAYQKAAHQGYIPYVSRTPLSRLSTTAPDDYNRP